MRKIHEFSAFEVAGNGVVPVSIEAPAVAAGLLALSGCESTSAGKFFVVPAGRCTAHF
jgi:hypothetical protein